VIACSRTCSSTRRLAALRLYGSFGFSATANPYGARDLYIRLHID
jgi:hypothetical protein